MVESARSAGDPGLTPGSGRSPGEGSGYPLQYSGLENSMDRGTWQAAVQGVARVRHDLASKAPHNYMGFPGGSAGKESACSVGDLGSVPGLGRSPGEGSGYPLQYSGPENSMNCIVHGVAKSQT